MRRLSLTLIGGFVGLLIVASSAEADALLFTDRAAWAAAAGTHRTFTQPDSTVYDPISQTVSLTFGGIGVGYDYVNLGSNGTGWYTDNSGWATGFSIDRNIRGFGFDFGAGFYGSVPPDYNEWVSYATRATLFLPTTAGMLTPTLQSGGFFGVLLSPDLRFEGYGLFELDTSACAYCDRLRQGVSTSDLAIKTPEGGSTAALLGLGLAGIVLARRKRAARRASPAPLDIPHSVK